MFLGYDQITVTAAVQTVANLTVPAAATHVQIQGETQDTRYTMDNVTNPTQTSGMVFSATAPEPVHEFLREDLQRIRFVRGAGVNGVLNLHYSAGRNI